MYCRIYLFLRITSVLIAGCVSGCVSGPKNSEQTFSEKLSADSYESSNSIVGVPVLTRKSISRNISGKVKCGDSLTQRPANRVTVNLFDGDNIIATASSDANGAYSMTANISTEKPYKLQAVEKCGTATKEIILKENSSFDLTLKN